MDLWLLSHWPFYICLQVVHNYFVINLGVTIVTTYQRLGIVENLGYVYPRSLGIPIILILLIYNIINYHEGIIFGCFHFFKSNL